VPVSIGLNQSQDSLFRRQRVWTPRNEGLYSDINGCWSRTRPLVYCWEAHGKREGLISALVDPGFLGPDRGLIPDPPGSSPMRFQGSPLSGNRQASELILSRF